MCQTEADARNTIIQWRTNYRRKSNKQGVIRSLLVNGVVAGDVGARYEGGWAEANIKEWGWQAFGTLPNIPASPHRGGYKTEQDAKRALACHVYRALFGATVSCPKCLHALGDQINDQGLLRTVQFYAVDLIQSNGNSPIKYRAHALIGHIEEDGTLVPSGDTDAENVPDPCWNTQTPMMNQHGYYRLACGFCCHEWYEPRVHYGEGGGAHGE
jgi:hypothetical protein